MVSIQREVLRVVAGFLVVAAAALPGVGCRASGEAAVTNEKPAHAATGDSPAAETAAVLVSVSVQEEAPPEPAEPAVEESGKDGGPERYALVSPTSWGEQLLPQEATRAYMPLGEIEWPGLWPEGDEPNEVSVAAAPDADAVARARKAYLAARQLSGEGQHAQALAEVEAGLEASPGDVELREMLAQLCYNLRLKPRAGQAARAVLASDPNALVALQVMGLLMQERGEFERAGAFFHRALQSPQAGQSNPATAVVQLQLANVLTRLEYRTAAIEAYERAWLLVRNQAGYMQADATMQGLLGQMHVPLLTRASLLVGLGRIGEAAGDLERVQELFGDRADIHGAFIESLAQRRVAVGVRFGQVQAMCAYLLAAEVKQSEWVLEQFYKACRTLARQDDYLVAMEAWSGQGLLGERERAFGLTLAGRSEQAVEVLAGLIEAGEADPLAHRDLARLHGSLGAWEEMLGQFGRFVEARPGETGAVTAGLRERLGREKGFQEALERLLGAEAGGVDSAGEAFLLAVLANGGERADVGEALLRRSLELADFEPAREELVELLLGQDRYDDVLEYARVNGEDGRMRLYSARACVGLGRLNEALGHYRVLVDAEPEEPMLRLALAGVLARQGELEEAERVVLDVIRQWPGRREAYAWLAGVYAAWSDRAADRPVLRQEACGRALGAWRKWLAPAGPDSAERPAGNPLAQPRQEMRVVTELLSDLREGAAGGAAAVLLAEAYALGGRDELAIGELGPVVGGESMLLAEAGRIYRLMDRPDLAATVSTRRWRQEAGSPERLEQALKDLDNAQRCEEAVDLLVEAVENPAIRGWRAANVLYDEALRVLSVARRFEEAAAVLGAWTWSALTSRETETLADRQRIEALERLWDRYVWCLVEAGWYGQARLQARAFYGRFQPETPTSGLYLARTLAARLRFEESTAAAESLCRAYPQNVSVRGQYWLGLIRAGRVDEALEEAANWAREAPEADRATREHLYVTLAWQGHRYEEALGWLVERLAERPEDGELWQMRVQTALLLGRFEEARAAVGEFEDHGADELEVLNVQLQVDIAQGDCSGALGRLRQIEQGREGLDLGPYRAELLANCGQVADAAERLEEQIEAGGADPDVRLRYSGVLDRLGRQAEAIAVLKELLAGEPDNPLLQNNVGFTLVEAGREPNLAFELLEKSLWAEPGSAPTLDSMGWFHYKSGEFARALGYILQAAGRVASVDPELYDHLGDTMYRLGQVRQAQEYWRLALDEVRRRAVFDRQMVDHQAKLERKLSQLDAGEEVEITGLFEKASM